jgi:hypothetical protein
MFSVDVSDLEDELKGELPNFVESRLSVKADQEGNVVNFEDRNERTHVSKPEIKTLLKRFMHAKELRKKYRLLSSDGTMKFVKLRPDQMEEDEEEEEQDEKAKK